MKKGIVMEIDDAFLTLLTPEGEFLHARRQNQPYAIGEEIHFFPIESVKTTNRFNTLKNVFKLKPVWALMAALFIFLGSFFSMYQNNKAYAYLSIDVNPSIELGINKKMQVIEITGFNKEGKKIISRLNDWKKKDVSELAQTILAEIQKEGFLKTEEHVIISTVRTTAPDGKIEKKLQENIEEIKASVSKQKLELTVLKATEKELEKAHKLGITTGKYQDSKIQDSNNQKVKTKSNGKQIDKKAVPTSSVDPTPPCKFKKQTENNAIKNKEIIEKKKQTEKKWLNEKSIPPGQLKKNEEEQFKQKQGQQKKQNYQKEVKSDNKKSINNNEKHKGKGWQKNRSRDNSKYNEKNNEKHNEKNNNRYYEIHNNNQYK
jgi:Anti-sigma factor N-terminus